jgi:hypothetical protein
MPTPRTRQTARLRAHRRRARTKARWIALLVGLGALGLIALLLTAFSAGREAVGPQPASSTTSSTGLLRPVPQPLATVGNLQIVVPVAASSVTGIGYHGSQDGALELQPAGRQANEGLLARLWRRIVGTGRDTPIWYQLDGGPGTGVVDVGVAPGTDIYAPVDGTIVSISDEVIAGARVASRIDIRPTDAPAVTLSIRNLEPDPSLSVGAAVADASSKLGTAGDIAAVEHQALSRYARDNGNNVSISVYPASGTLP